MDLKDKLIFPLYSNIYNSKSQLKLLLIDSRYCKFSDFNPKSSFILGQTHITFLQKFYDISYRLLVCTGLSNPLFAYSFLKLEWEGQFDHFALNYSITVTSNLHNPF